MSTSVRPTDPGRHLAIGRLAAMHTMPYFSTALRSMVPRPIKGLGTVGVSEHWMLAYDPDVILTWSVKELAAALLHEVNHLIRGHMGRCKRMGAEPQLWNIASDCEINDDIIGAGLTLPVLDPTDTVHGGICLPSKFELPDGKTAEWYYNEILKKAKPCPQCAAGDDGKGPQGKGKGGKPEDGDGDDDGKGQGQGQGKCEHDKPGAGGGWCGSGAGRKIPGMPEDGNGGRSEAEAQRIRRETAGEIKKHLQKNGRGTVGGSLEEWANEILAPPQVRWEDKLKMSMRGALHWAAGKVDMRQDGMGRRQGAIGYGVGVAIMPRLRRPCPRVVVIRDSSGSMGINTELALCNSEIEGLCKAAGVDIELIDIDTEIKAQRKIRRGSDARNVAGRGGTDMCPAFEALNARPRHQQPHIVVLMTDGYTPVPDLPGAYRTICCRMGSNAATPWKISTRTPCTEGDWFHADIPVVEGGKVPE